MSCEWSIGSEPGQTINHLPTKLCGPPESLTTRFILKAQLSLNTLPESTRTGAPSTWRRNGPCRTGAMAARDCGRLE
jgi:hypothetical protein